MRIILTAALLCFTIPAAAIEAALGDHALDYTSGVVTGCVAIGNWAMALSSDCSGCVAVGDHNMYASSGITNATSINGHIFASEQAKVFWLTHSASKSFTNAPIFHREGDMRFDVTPSATVSTPALIGHVGGSNHTETIECLNATSNKMLDLIVELDAYDRPISIYPTNCTSWGEMFGITNLVSFGIDSKSNNLNMSNYVANIVYDTNGTFETFWGIECISVLPQYYFGLRFKSWLVQNRNASGALIGLTVNSILRFENTMTGSLFSPTDTLKPFTNTFATASCAIKMGRHAPTITNVYDVPDSARSPATTQYVENKLSNCTLKFENGQLNIYTNSVLLGHITITQ